MKSIIVAVGIVMGIMLYTIGFVMGYMTPAVTYSDPIPAIHERYNHIKIYEDGSYEGQTESGMDVTGCVQGALCDREG